MTDFETMMKDARRMMKAIRKMADVEVKEHPSLAKSLGNKIGATFIMVNRALNTAELERACETLRALFKDLNKRELEYERELVSDPAQGRREASVRHSPEDVPKPTVPAPMRVLERRKLPSRGSLANPHNWPYSASVPNVAAERDRPAISNIPGPRQDASGVAGTLPKRKGRSRRQRNEDRRRRNPVEVGPKEDS